MGIYAITGGATGIGAAVREQLQVAHHKVMVVDIKNADIIADLSTKRGREKAIECIKVLAPDGLDGFIACAGVGPHITPYSLITQVNYFGAVATIEGVKDLVAKKKGSIVLISSNSATMGYPTDYVDLCLAGKEEEACNQADELDGMISYGGSKLAIARWMRRNTVAYKNEGVRMNAVAPGFTKTPLTDKLMEDEKFGEFMKDYSATMPVGSMAQPEQIADVICWLLSPAASFVCGSVIFADGGFDAMLRPDQF